MWWADTGQFDTLLVQGKAMCFALEGMAHLVSLELAEVEPAGDDECSVWGYHNGGFVAISKDAMHTS